MPHGCRAVEGEERESPGERERERRRRRKRRGKKKSDLTKLPLTKRIFNLF